MKRSLGFSPIFLVIGGAVTFLLIGVGIGFFKSKNITKIAINQRIEQKNEESQQIVNKVALQEDVLGDREVGKSGEFYPYGKIDETKIRSFSLNYHGGAFPIELSGDVTMYFNFPVGISEDYFAEFTPYYSMPTAENAPPLSNSLGYGVDFTLEGTRQDELPHRMYLVFDLDKGETIKSIRKDPILSFFCDPSDQSFNPSVCAYLKGVPLSDHTNYQYAVVRPVRTTEYSHLISMMPTIPIGFENLLVVEIDAEGTYIPQQLSRPLLRELLVSNVGTKTIAYSTEGIVHALQNSIYDPAYNDKILLGLAGSTIADKLKLHFMFPKAKEFASAQGKDTSQLKRYIQQNNESLQRELRTLSRNELNSTDILTAIGYLKRLESDPIINVSKEKDELLDSLEEEFVYYQDEQNEYDYLINLLLSVALLYGKESTYFPFIPQAYAETKNAGLDGLTAGPPEWMERTKKTINKICSDPKSTSQQISNTIFVAGRIGDTAGQEKCRQKLCASLEHDLKNKQQGPIEVAADWTTYQKACANDSENYQEYLDKLTNSYDKQVCKTLMQKNLRNFAWNEIQCSRFQNTEGYIDDVRFKTLEELKEQIRYKTSP